MRFFERLIQLLCSLFVIWTLSTKCSAEDLTNLQFLTNLTDSLLQAATQDISERIKKKVVIRSLAVNKEVDWFIENQLVKFLHKRDVQSIYLNQDTLNAISATTRKDTISIFEFKLLTIGIEYFEENSQGLSKAGYVNRKGSISIYLRIIEQSTGEILWNGDIEKSQYDWIPLAAIDRLENPNVPFSKGVLIKNRGRTTILKPILITGITGIIVYLFYSLRSR
ncbi:MAG: hypothetical protein ACE5HI_02700 [bacterium]